MRNMIKLATLLTVFLLALTGCGTEQSNVTDDGYSTEDYSITLNYSDHDPPNGMRTEFLEEYWFPAIEEETDGKVTINAIYGGGLLSSDEALDGIRDGVADIGLVYPDNYPQRMYSYELFKLFPVAPDEFDGMYNIFNNALNELPRLEEDLERNNQKPLLITTGLPVAFGSTDEINNLEDIAGDEWRASSRWYLEAITNLEASPVSVPWEDVYMSLETGVIDGVMTNYDGFHMTNLYESAPEIIVGTELWWSSPFIHTINNDIWESMPIDIQEDILRASEQAQQEFGKVYQDELETTIEEQEESGANVKIADQEDIEAFYDKELFDSLRETWVQEAENDHDIENADEYVENLKEIMNEELGYEEY